MRVEEIPPRGALHAAERELRFEVLRAPLGLRRDQVSVDGEERARHFVALDARGAVVGCGLLVVEPAGGAAAGRLRQMAVAPALQRSGVGQAIVREIERAAREAGVRRITLHAREAAVGFYAKLGYVAFGEPFVEIGIPHLAMARELG